LLLSHAIYGISRDPAQQRPQTRLSQESPGARRRRDRERRIRFHEREERNSAITPSAATELATTTTLLGTQRARSPLAEISTRAGDVVHLLLPSLPPGVTPFLLFLIPLPPARTHARTHVRRTTFTPRACGVKSGRARVAGARWPPDARVLPLSSIPLLCLSLSLSLSFSLSLSLSLTHSLSLLREHVRQKKRHARTRTRTRTRAHVAHMAHTVTHAHAHAHARTGRYTFTSRNERS